MGYSDMCIGFDSNLMGCNTGLNNNLVNNILLPNIGTNSNLFSMVPMQGGELGGFTNAILPSSNSMLVDYLNIQAIISGILSNMRMTNVNPAPSVGPSNEPKQGFFSRTWDKIKGSSFGKYIARTAEKVGFRKNTSGWCYRGVKETLNQAGVNLEGGSAYQAADQLARNSKFKEVRVPKSELSKLPAGAVVVWSPYTDNRGNYHKHGHISVALGDGREASDNVRSQLKLNGDCRVFIPTA